VWTTLLNAGISRSTLVLIFHYHRKLIWGLYR
jgi:hypothetical protein